MRRPTRAELHKAADAILDGPGKEFRIKSVAEFRAVLESKTISTVIPAQWKSSFEFQYLTSYGIAVATHNKVRRDGEQQFRWFRQLKDGSFKQINYKGAKDRVYYVDNIDKRRAQQKVWRESKPDYFKNYYRDTERTRLDATAVVAQETEFGDEMAFVVALHRIDSLKNRLKRERDRKSPKGWKKPDNWTPKDQFLCDLKPHWALATDNKHVWTVYHFEAGKWRLKAAEPFKERLLLTIKERVPDAYPDKMKEIQSWPTECINWLKQQKEK